jgi:hypothetical protein
MDVYLRWHMRPLEGQEDLDPEMTYIDPAAFQPVLRQLPERHCDADQQGQSCSSDLRQAQHRRSLRHLSRSST